MNNKLQSVEDFYYNGEKIEKGTTISILDVKTGFSRSGIIVEVQISRDYISETKDKSFSAKEKKEIHDWIDIGMVFPMKEHFVLPRGTSAESIEELRLQQLKDDDKNLYSTWKEMIEKGEPEKVIKSMVTRLTSDKFGI